MRENAKAAIQISNVYEEMQCDGTFDKTGAGRGEHAIYRRGYGGSFETWVQRCD